MDNRTRPIGTLESAATSWGVALLAGLGTFALLLLIADWSILQAIFGASVTTVVIGFVLMLTVGRPASLPLGEEGVQEPTAALARADMPGKPGQPGRPLTPRDLNAPSPHKEGIDHSAISDAQRVDLNSPAVNRALSSGPGGTSMAEPAPATRVPAPAPINAADAGVARPVGATSNPVAQEQPTPLDGAIVSPEPPEPIDPAAAAAPRIDRNEAAKGGGAAPGPAPTAGAKAQSYNESTSPASATASGTSGASVSGVDVAPGEERKPPTLDAPRGGKADDLKRIRGVGPKLEETCNGLGFWHFDQIAAWTDREVAWVDQNLEGFRGRVSRDDWVVQARELAAGGDTDFSRRVDDGDVY